ncbi:MAG TPA: T9SS type A sorting domain-containing protein, partial [Bacteroidota bacterium]|nr:T9SS type A sorting domain-containing protein [Bacteroidota bacterium]
YGEGKTFLGSADVVTNAGCAASFSVTFPVSVPTGHSISATATDTANNTSEFSRGFAVGTTSVQQMEDVPKTFELLQNYPNPFNPTATIRYALPTPSKVTLKVYDVLGEEVATLTDGVQEAGFKSVQFEGTGLASGVYFYRLQARPSSSSVGGQAREFVGVKRLLLLK